MIAADVMKELIKSRAAKNPGPVQIRQMAEQIDVPAIDRALQRLNLHVVGVRDGELRLEFVSDEAMKAADLEALPGKIIECLRQVPKATRGIRAVSVG
jgi:hypothetical protein